MNVIFFDAECPVCCQSVGWVLKIDKKAYFMCAPLQGETAKRLLRPSDLTLDTLIVLEQNKIWRRARGVLRIFWLIGGSWKSLGIFCFIPFFPDLLYRLIAHNRSRSKKKKMGELKKLYPDRFMP